MQNEVELYSKNSPVWFHIVKTFMPIQWKNVYEATEMAIAARAMSGANVELIKRTDSVEVGGYPTSILYFANVVDKDTIIQKQYVTYLEDSHIVIYFNENFYSNQWDEAQKYGEKIIGSVKLKKVVNPLEKDSVMKEAIQKAMDGNKIQKEYIEKGKKVVRLSLSHLDRVLAWSAAHLLFENTTECVLAAETYKECNLTCTLCALLKKWHSLLKTEIVNVCCERSTPFLMEICTEICAVTIHVTCQSFDVNIWIKIEFLSLILLEKCGKILWFRISHF